VRVLKSELKKRRTEVNRTEWRAEETSRAKDWGRNSKDTPTRIAVEERIAEWRRNSRDDRPVRLHRVEDVTFLVIVIVNNLSNKSTRLIRSPLTSCRVARMRDNTIPNRWCFGSWIFFPFSGEWLRDGQLLSWVSQKEVISVTGSSRVLWRPRIMSGNAGLKYQPGHNLLWVMPWCFSVTLGQCRYTLSIMPRRLPSKTKILPPPSGSKRKPSN
jgi:hypothetical protein